MNHFISIPNKNLNNQLQSIDLEESDYIRKAFGWRERLTFGHKKRDPIGLFFVTGGERGL